MLNILPGYRKLLKQIEEKAGKHYPKDLTHDFHHAKRVMGIAFMIAEELEENLDALVLGASALLHDVGRLEADRDHSSASAEIAERILEELGVDRTVIARVREAILVHSYSGGKHPSSLEAIVLKDADMLDAMGAVGISRVFCYSCLKQRGWGETIMHFHEKILKLSNLLKTEPARRMAARRRRIVEDFLRELDNELSVTCFLEKILQDKRENKVG